MRRNRRGGSSRSLVRRDRQDRIDGRRGDTSCREARPGFVQRDRSIGDRASGRLRERARQVRVPDGFPAGEDVLPAHVRLDVEQHFGRHRRDVPGVDERHAPVADGRVDRALGPHRLRDVPEPVLHEGVRTQDGPPEPRAEERLLDRPMLAGDGRPGVVGRAQGRELDDVCDAQLLGCPHHPHLRPREIRFVAGEEEQSLGPVEGDPEPAGVVEIGTHPADVR